MSQPKIRPRIQKRTIVKDTSGNVIEDNKQDAGVIETPEVNDVTTEQERIPSNYIAVPLWSAGIFSHGIEDKLHLRPLFIADILKISNAVQMDDFDSFVEVISNTVYENVDIKKLPQKDFEGILYWLRINSTFLESYQADFICESLDHIEKVENKIVKAETLIQTVELASSSFDERHVDEDIFKHIQFLQSDIEEMCGITMDIQTVQTQMEYSKVLDHRTELVKKKVLGENADKMDQENVPAEVQREILGLLGMDQILKTSLLASYMSPKHGDNLKQRTNSLINNERLTQAALKKMQEYVEYLDENIGVTETVKHVCEVCSAELATNVAFSALDFLS
ncbi:MAG: hypothetical protein WC967_09235 [Balneolaceae bacterium]